MFWGSVPTALSLEEQSNLFQANYLMTFNEPEMSFQSNVLPEEAAAQWAQIESIASSYNLKIVAPCVVGDPKGFSWYNEWLGNCTDLLDRSCAFDYTCMHLYYQPWNSATGSCDTGVFDWACIGPDAAKAVNRINQFYTSFGSKPTWLTEWACAPWGGSDCDEAKHTAIMEQMIPVVHDNPQVYRYSWYTAFDARWVHNSLNELAWQRFPEKTCPPAHRKWVGGFGTANWQMKTLHECVTKAEADISCARPLKLSMDDNNCYCSNATDTCNENQLIDTYAAMSTYHQVGAQDSSTLTALGQYYNSYGVSPPSSEPSSSPSSAPSSAPVPASVPSAAPIPLTSAPVTDAPTQSCLAGGEGLGCNAQTNCCAGVGSCTGGQKASRTCLPASGVSPTGPPTTCGGNKSQCQVDADCCSNNCESNNQCRGNRRLGQTSLPW